MIHHILRGDELLSNKNTLRKQILCIRLFMARRDESRRYKAGQVENRHGEGSRVRFGKTCNVGKRKSTQDKPVYMKLRRCPQRLLTFRFIFENTITQNVTQTVSGPLPARNYPSHKNTMNPFTQLFLNTS